MPRLVLCHWKAAEAPPVIGLLRSAGYDVDYSERLHSFKRLRESPPAAVVFDLTRLPSHSREVAIAIRGTKGTRHLPLVFINGDHAKVEVIRKLLPDATYVEKATVSSLKNALRAAIRTPVLEPVVPPQMMERSRRRTAAQKLGIQPGSQVAVIDAPIGYEQVLGPLPDSVTLEEQETSETRVTLWFLHDADHLFANLRALRRTAARHRLWALWRKGRKDELNGGLIRSAAIDMGLVDYKVCSVDEVWSGLALTVKKSK